MRIFAKKADEKINLFPHQMIINEFIIYCPDCRGKFEVEANDLAEEDILECDLCGAEIMVIETDPIKLKLLDPEEDFE